MFCGYLIAFTLIARNAVAEPAEAPPAASPNAALRYWPAFDLMPRSEADLATIGDWQHAKLDESTVKLLERGRQSLNYLHAGATMPRCDWGLDLGQGPYVLLPHLARSRDLARLACLRIRYEFQQHQPAAAVEDACDVLACARHTGHDAILISMLVQYSMERMALEALASGLDTLDSTAMKHLTDRLDHLPASSTLADAVRTEREIDVEWAIAQVRAGGEKPDWPRIFSFVTLAEGANAGTSVDALIKSAGGTPDAVIRDLEGLVPYHDEVANLLKTPLSQQEFRRKTDEARRRVDGNPFAKPMLPAFTIAYDAAASAEARRTLLRAAIAVIERGPEAIKTFVDPVNRQPLEYTKRAEGFELTSKAVYRDLPVTLDVGSGN